jgi:hypothetical protein
MDIFSSRLLRFTPGGEPYVPLFADQVGEATEERLLAVRAEPNVEVADGPEIRGTDIDQEDVVTPALKAVARRGQAAGGGGGGGG